MNSLIVQSLLLLTLSAHTHKVLESSVVFYGDLKRIV